MKRINFKEFDLFIIRKPQNYIKIERQVKEIINKVKQEKDEAIKFYAYKFDNTDLNKTGFKLTQEEIERAYKKVKKNRPELIESLKLSIERIKEFHKNQLEKSFILTKEGEVLGQIINPIEKVLIYVPGGKAVYPSTLIMNAIPALIAGVKEIYITSPAKENKINEILPATAFLLGLNRFYIIGGAHAIAGFAYGTETLPAVDKICGPGNIYVTIAKRFVYGDVDIDMIAGPTEVVIIADKNSNPLFIACDLLSQAEHDEMARPILITSDKSIADKVEVEINRLLEKYKNSIARKSIEKNGLIILTDSVERSFEIANKIAPEHLEILIEEPMKYLPLVQNAGSVFLGEYTPESFGDYIGGPNHTLPTMGTARFFSPLGVYDFIKRTSFMYVSKNKFKKLYSHISNIAETEKLFFHSLSAKIRFKNPLS